MRSLASVMIVMLAVLLTLAGLTPAAAQETPGDPGCPTPLPLNIGDIIFLRGGVNIRNNPTLSGGLVNRSTGGLQDWRLIDGPVCADGFNWWQVTGRGNDGWAAEGAWLIPQVVPPPEVLCGAPLSIAPGATIELLTGLRVRSQANLGGRVLTVAPTGAMAQVLAGPVCADEINWWQVRVTVLGVVHSGWIAQARFGVDFVLPQGAGDLSLCRPALRLSDGDRVEVKATPNAPRNLRTRPRSDGALIATLINNVGLEVTGEPVCADGMNWWPVRVLSRPDVAGWIAEGGTGNLFIRRIEVPEGLPGS